MKLTKHPKYKQLPEIITDRVDWENIDIEKVFPSLGLENSVKKTVIRKKFVKDKMKEFEDKVDKGFQVMSDLYKNKKVKSQENYFKEFRDGWRNRDRANIDNLHADCNLYSIAWPIGSLAELNTNLLKYRALSKFDRIFKISKTFKIGFSSDEWDIATMSMRGIESCQRWTGSQNLCLNGSILDPNCAIIFITKQKQTQYGIDMLYRAVVRYIKKGNKYGILIENIYAKDYSCNEMCIIKDLFKRYLKDHISKDIEVIYSNEDDYEGWQIPMSPQVKALNKSDLDCLSYRDSGIEYSK